MSCAKLARFWDCREIIARNVIVMRGNFQKKVVSLPQNYISRRMRQSKWGRGGKNPEPQQLILVLVAEWKQEIE